jgi:hypothetical protein
MAWLESPKRVAASSDMPGRGACILRTQDYLMGLPIFVMLREEREPAELKHLSRRRKRKQLCDAVSKVDRTRHRTN